MRLPSHVIKSVPHVVLAMLIAAVPPPSSAQDLDESSMACLSCHAALS
jgi:hypothetical protein